VEQRFGVRRLRVIDSERLPRRLHQAAQRLATKQNRTGPHGEDMQQVRLAASRFAENREPTVWPILHAADPGQRLGIRRGLDKIVDAVRVRLREREC
jgi:hypothetical protein